ncbi:MAG: hypothetical protein N3J91_14715 [Verrucomicrobiae bacterium]|nr:hypothetical protein [Verrucomicrobiae bacterium]
MKTLTVKWPPRLPASRRLPAAAWLMIWMSWSGCHAPKVIPADQLVLRVEAHRPFTAPCDGWFLSDALYQRTRRAVADRILELETQSPPARP